MRSAGGEVFDFGIGEMNPEIPLPASIKEAITEAFKEDATHYSPAGGDPELVELPEPILHPEELASTSQ